MSAQKAAQGAPRAEMVAVHQAMMQMGLHLGPSWGPLCKPTCTTCVLLPGAPQPFWFKGPLEPPLGGHFHHTDSALQRAWKQPVIHHSEYNLWRAIAFWNVHCGTLAGRGPPGHRPGRDRARRGGKRERSSSRTYTLSRRPCALNHTIEVVIITDEPALVAEPGWLLFSRLTR